MAKEIGSPERDIKGILEQVGDTVLREHLLAMHEANLPAMLKWPAAVKHHHWWAGGYHDHVFEVMVNMLFQIEGLQRWYGELPPGVYVDRAILLGYIHDLDKLERYEYNRYSGKNLFMGREETPVCESSALVQAKCYEHGVSLDKNDLHCLAFHHGAFSGITKEFPWAVPSPMATLLHTADLISARIGGRTAPPDRTRK